MGSVIEIQEIEFAYNRDTKSDSTVLFKDFSLTIGDGELLTMLGPSGCGKTTLIRLVAGLIRPNAGRILCNGQLIQGPSMERGVVFQGDTCFPWLTVRQNIAFGLAPDHDAHSVDALLNLVGLISVGNYFPRRLSYGMRQRVALARAIAGGAKVFLLDEPLSALDALTRSVLQEDLSRILRNPGQAALWATHDLEEALLLGDRIIIVSGQPLRVIHEILPDFQTDNLRERRLSETFRNLRQELFKIALGAWHFGK
jgi:ABC-type nitrate/sulfonate/bicarbonate transport system ATPase subunit